MSLMQYFYFKIPREVEPRLEKVADFLYSCGYTCTARRQENFIHDGFFSINGATFDSGPEDRESISLSSLAEMRFQQQKGINLFFRPYPSKNGPNILTCIGFDFGFIEAWGELYGVLSTRYFEGMGAMRQHLGLYGFKVYEMIAKLNNILGGELFVESNNEVLTLEGVCKTASGELPIENFLNATLLGGRAVSNWPLLSDPARDKIATLVDGEKVYGHTDEWKNKK